MSLSLRYRYHHSLAATLTLCKSGSLLANMNIEETPATGKRKRAKHTVEENAKRAERLASLNTALIEAKEGFMRQAKAISERFGK